MSLSFSFSLSHTHTHTHTHTAIDAAECGFMSFIVDDCSKAVAPDSKAVMEARLKEHGVVAISSKEVPMYIMSVCVCRYVRKCVCVYVYTCTACVCVCVCVCCPREQSLKEHGDVIITSKVVRMYITCVCVCVRMCVCVCLCMYIVCVCVCVCVLPLRAKPL